MATGFKTYTRMLGGLVAASLALLAGFHLRVDPWGAHPLLADAELAPYRGDMDSRVGTGERLHAGGWDTVVLGSSRAQVGIDPHHRLWGPARVYDAGLRGGRMLECAGALRVAAEDPTLRRVFLFVDFFSFNARPRFANDYEESRLNPDLVLVEYWSGNLFGLRSIGAALDVLERARKEEPPAIDELGFRRQESSAAVGATEAFEVVIENFVTDPGLYGSWTLGEEQVGSFREAVALCRERDLELVVAVLPVHATLLETLRGLGLWEAREDWLRTLVTVLEEEGGPTLWDFTSYTGTATEPVTTAAGHRRRAAWFRDASHMTSKLGTIVLRDLLRPDPEAAELGRRVDSANLDEHFERIESDRREYLRYQSDDVAFVRRLLERIRSDY